MRLRILAPVVAFTLAGLSLAEAQQPPPGTQRLVERRETCTGEFGTSPGTAGSYIGARCFVPANSDPERAIQRVCKQKSICSVDAQVRPEQGRVVITKVFKVEMAQAPVPVEPLAKRLGKLIDGILAPASSGCNSRHRPTDRVAFLLDAADGGTVQLFAQYCVVTNVRGPDPSDKSIRATLEARCGAASQEETLRKGKTGRKIDIVVARNGDDPLTIDSVPYVRCPITQTSTPEWWINRHPQYQGKFPQ